MFCAISGEVPQQPVVTKSGQVYERRLIEVYIAENGRDPVTGEALALEDVIDIKNQPTAVKPRTPSATSIPSLLVLLQNEWDAIMLESFSLKQQFEQTRQELSHALYQNEAACRVIARLLKERNAAREALATLKAPGSEPGMTEPTTEDAMDVDAATSSSALPQDVIEQVTTTAAELSKQRKKRKAPEGLISAEELGSFTLQSSLSQLHQSGHPGILALDVNPRNSDEWVTAGVDKTLLVHSRASGKTTSTPKAHTKQVNAVCWHSTQDVLVSGSADKTVRIWSRNDGDSKFKVVYNIKAHSGEVCAVAYHPCQDYVYSAADDGHWALHHLETGATVCDVDGESSYASLAVHPDGLLLGVGAAEGGVVKLWDLRSQSIAFTCPEQHQGRVASLAFSENGYHFASAANEAVKIWDLRKLAKTHEIQMDADYNLHRIRYNAYGNFLAVVGSDLRVYQAKQWSLLLHVTGENEADFTDVVFGNVQSTFLATASMDRSLKFFGRA